MRIRTVAVIGVMASVLTACSTTPETTSTPTLPPPSTEQSDAVALEAIEEGPREDVPSALSDPTNNEIPEPQVDVSRIISGGPPPDGIPPIDSPVFENAAEVSWLDDDEPVIALSSGDQHRAYPVQVLMWHEIVNDTIGGRPVAVTYCPLCNSALAFDRQVGDRLLSFGTSGSLYLSALVMYDRQTESLWSQVERRAIAGHLSGTELELIPVSMVRWSDWRAAHPDGWVLSRETGFDRSYGTNPYVGYDELSNEDTFLDQAADSRFPAKERIVTFPDASTPVAVRLSSLADAQVAHISIDSGPVVLFSAAGLASALQSSDIADGRQISATGAFIPSVNGDQLTFSPPTGTTQSSVVAVDDQTGSGWSILGEALSGPLEGEQLNRVPHLDTFWFAQAAFKPDTEVLTLGDAEAE